ncbi:hypothetical protein GIB67_033393 [Kingdonia uniflora]|uniref:F-box domain-containing protein n=1 Tax=Kingdonia uniflora TaxID=39325 RepID=A0A7J7LU14_9MAGN|nr:hypothetical protein GIB67_033393 [Kingdonia uniflora]
MVEVAKNKKRKTAKNKNGVDRTMPVIPDEIIVEILSRLPVKPLFRFKSVCKIWNCLPSDPKFVNLHLKQSRKAPPISIALFRDEQRYGPYYAHFSIKCLGKVVQNLGTKYLYLCNPSTREVIELPYPTSIRILNLSDHNVCGVGFDASSNKYKVFNTFLHPDGAYGETPNVYAYGMLHSLDDYTSLLAIHSFDFQEEKFRVTPVPKYEKGNVKWGDLKILQGDLCFVELIESSTLNLWVLKDYTSLNWVKQHAVDLYRIGVAIEVFERCWIDVEDGKVKLKCGNWLYSYDLRRKTVETVVFMEPCELHDYRYPNHARGCTKEKEDSEDGEEVAKKRKIERDMCSSCLRSEVKLDSTIPLIPDEVIEEILSKLPVKSLFRFKSVCKLWDHLPSDPKFVNLHLKQSHKKPPTAIAFFRDEYVHPYDPHVSYFSIRCLGKVVQNLGIMYPVMNIALPSHFYTMGLPCDGLICFPAQCLNRIYLCNPGTCEALELPRPTTNRILYSTFNYVCRIGFDAFNNNYKVFNTFHCPDGSLWGEILTLGSLEWRSVGIYPYLNEETRSVYANRMLHRLNSFLSPSVILSFDFHEEAFLLTPVPAYDIINFLWGELTTLAGNLCFFNKMESCTLNMWVLKDYTSLIWVKEHTIDLHQIGVPIEIIKHCIVEVQNGKITFKCGNWLYNYNPQRKTVGTVVFAEPRPLHDCGKLGFAIEIVSTSEYLEEDLYVNSVL